MVDLANDTDVQFDAAANRAAEPRTPFSFDIVTDSADAHALLDSLSPEAVHSGYQAPPFLKHWLKAVTDRPLFLMLTPTSGAKAGPVILPLEMLDDCTARYLGGRHANGNFPIGKLQDIAALGELDPKALRHLMRRFSSDPCSLVLERQLPEIAGIANPFINVRSTRSPNVALSLEVADGFDAVLSARNGKRLRKKMRSSTRKLEERGTIEFITANDSATSSAIMDKFFALKAEHFTQAGIFNVFGDAPTQAFFRALFDPTEQAKTAKTRYVLHALMLDDAPIALIGCTAHGDRITVEFGTFDMAYSDVSLGDLLFYKTIEHYCDAGFAEFSFGIGDEPYKRRWCDVETWQMDTFVPGNLRGEVIA
ncbi:MAG: GNAT family N-acetyltransferase, partial [Pseudomonadota bacterium]